MSQDQIIIKTTKESRFGRTVNIENTEISFDKKGFALVSSELSHIVDNETIFLSNKDKSAFQSKDELIEELKKMVVTLTEANKELRESLDKAEASKSLLEGEILTLKALKAGESNSNPDGPVNTAPKSFSQMSKEELIGVGEELSTSLGSEIFDLEAFKALNKKEMIVKLEEILKSA